MCYDPVSRVGLIGISLLPDVSRVSSRGEIAMNSAGKKVSSMLPDPAVIFEMTKLATQCLISTVGRSHCWINCSIGLSRYPESRFSILDLMSKFKAVAVASL